MPFPVGGDFSGPTRRRALADDAKLILFKTMASPAQSGSALERVCSACAISAATASCGNEDALATMQDDISALNARREELQEQLRQLQHSATFQAACGGLHHAHMRALTKHLVDVSQQQEPVLARLRKLCAPGTFFVSPDQQRSFVRVLGEEMAAHLHQVERWSEALRWCGSRAAGESSVVLAQANDVHALRVRTAQQERLFVAQQRLHTATDRLVGQY